MRTRVVTALGLIVCVAACAGVTPEQQHAMDQQTCASYGFKPDSDRFADCMMQSNQRREDKQTAKQQQREYFRSLSVRRNNDTKYPLCSAMSQDSSLDVSTGKWFGPDCREE
jgi:hypothetical protein